MKSLVAAVFIVGLANAIPNGYYQQMRIHAVPMVAMHPPPMSAKLLNNPDCDPVADIPVASEGAMSFVYGAGDHIASGGFVTQTQQSGSIDTIGQREVTQEQIEKAVAPEIPAKAFDTGSVDQPIENISETLAAHESSENKFEATNPESVLVIPVEIESQGAEATITESKATESAVYGSNVSETTGYKVLDTALEESESTISKTDVSGSAGVEVKDSNREHTDSLIEGSILNKVSESIVPGVKVSESSFESKVTESSESKTSTVDSKPVVTTNVKDETSREVNKKTSTDVSSDDDEVSNRYDSRRGGTYFPIHFSSFPAARSNSGASGGVVSIANSYSTGRGGVASSQSTAYGSAQSDSST